MTKPTAKTGDDATARRAARENETAFASEFESVRRHCEAGEFHVAERLCRQLWERAPGRPQLPLMLGQILWSQGRHRDAIATLGPLVERYPDLGAARFSLGNALHSAGRHAEAARHLRRAVELQPRLAGGHCNLGLALERLGDRAGAIRAYRRALALRPDLAVAHLHLGIALLEDGNPEGAVAHLGRAAAPAPGTARVDYLLGLALRALGKKDEALACLERAVSAEPNWVQGWLGLGAALRELGRFAEAARAFERVLAIDPGDGVARHALSTVRLKLGDAGELDRLRRLLTNTEFDAGHRGAAGMAMAKILDDSGRWDEAFAAAVEGNRIARQGQASANVHYDHGAFRARNDALMRTFTPRFFARTRDWGVPSEAPVFIVGFFRTGSTLVEQICASHSQVHGLGESHDIPRIAARIQDFAPADWTAPMFRALADGHVDRLASLAPAKSRVVDKMLDNLWRLGLIAALFPRARVIFTHRDGRDAALSVLMHHFGREVAFATDLLDAGRRWRETERMCAHWGRCLPLAMHHVQYETLIGDFETETRKLIDFLGLPWEPGCLQYYKTERAVNTASAWQVRQPPFDRSVGRWRHYAKHLTELCAVLGVDPEAPIGAAPTEDE